jgi:hypothetical protein
MLGWDAELVAALLLAGQTVAPSSSWVTIGSSE